MKPTTTSTAPVRQGETKKTPPGARLRIDGRMASSAIPALGTKEEVFFVTHATDEPARRPTLFLAALCSTQEDREWFERVTKCLEGLMVPS